MRSKQKCYIPSQIQHRSFSDPFWEAQLELPRSAQMAERETNEYEGLDLLSLPHLRWPSEFEIKQCVVVNV